MRVWRSIWWRAMLWPVLAIVPGAVLLVGLGWGIGELITGSVGMPLVDGVDHPTMLWVAANRNDLLDAAMRATTHLGDRIAVVALLGAAAVAATANRSRRWAGFFLFALLGATLLSGTIKQLVGRPRPDVDRLVEIGGLSFPSGHATAAAICYGSLAVAALTVRTRPRIALAALCISLAVVIAGSRVWLGVHYPTDVVAGLLFGSAWVAIGYIAFLREGSDKTGVYPADTAGRRGRVA